MRSRALVLGAGGVAGVAWEIGVVSGLHRAGVDLTAADLVVGTSAGAVVGTLVAGGVDPERAIAAQLDAYPVEPPLRPDLERGMQAFALLGSGGDEEAIRASIGALAEAADVGDEQARVDVFAAHLPVQQWPTDRRLLITAVETGTGRFVAWSRESGVPLVRAVAASCAVPCVFPPVTIDGRRYMDGGVRSRTNADLAVGADTAVVLAPLAGLRLLGAPTSELDALRRRATVRLVAPDDAARDAFGNNLFDPSRRGAALAAGLAQGAALADEVRAIW